MEFQVFCSEIGDPDKSVHVEVVAETVEALADTVLAALSQSADTHSVEIFNENRNKYFPLRTLDQLLPSGMGDLRIKPLPPPSIPLFSSPDAIPSVVSVWSHKSTPTTTTTTTTTKTTTTTTTPTTTTSPASTGSAKSSSGQRSKPSSRPSSKPGSRTHTPPPTQQQQEQQQRQQQNGHELLPGVSAALARKKGVDMEFQLFVSRVGDPVSSTHCDVVANSLESLLTFVWAHFGVEPCRVNILGEGQNSFAPLLSLAPLISSGMGQLQIDESLPSVIRPDESPQDEDVPTPSPTPTHHGHPFEPARPPPLARTLSSSSVGYAGSLTSLPFGIRTQMGSEDESSMLAFTSGMTSEASLQDLFYYDSDSGGGGSGSGSGSDSHDPGSCSAHTTYEDREAGKGGKEKGRKRASSLHLSKSKAQPIPQSPTRQRQQQARSRQHLPRRRGPVPSSSPLGQYRSRSRSRSQSQSSRHNNLPSTAPLVRQLSHVLVREEGGETTSFSEEDEFSTGDGGPDSAGASSANRRPAHIIANHHLSGSGSGSNLVNKG